MDEIPEIIASIAPSFESSFPVRTPRHNNINDHLHKHNTHRDVDPENLVATISTQSSVSPPSSRIQEIFFIFVICMAQLFTTSGLALSVVTGHIIGESFPNTTPGLLSWFAAAYGLTVGTFILVAGRLGDLYGHKLMFIIGFSWMGLWSLLAGFSVWSNAIFFCVCRAFQGVGAGLLLPNAIAIFGRTYPPGRMKELAFSLFGAAAPGGSVVGGVFAALISERAWWPWSYWVMGIVCFCFAFLGLLAIPHTPSPRLTDNLSFVTRIDMFGAFFGISGLVLINFAWNQAPIVGWQDPYTYVLLIVGLLSLGAFALVERKATCPLLPTSVFTGDVAWALSCIAAGWSSFGIANYYWFQTMEVLENNSPLLAVGKWSAAPVMGIVAGLITAYLLSRVSPSVIMVIALSAFLAGSCLIATMPIKQTYWAQGFVMSIIYPFGMYVPPLFFFPSTFEHD
jgi:MFS family permease